MITTTTITTVLTIFKICNVIKTLKESSFKPYMFYEGQLTACANSSARQWAFIKLKIIKNLFLDLNLSFTKSLNYKLDVWSLKEGSCTSHRTPEYALCCIQC